MESILYSRISENRDGRFLLSTTILEEDGIKRVQKKAVNKEAENHLNKIYDNYLMLNKQYASSDVSICKCVKHSDSLEFDYCAGYSLEHLIDEQLKKGDVKTGLQIIEEFFEMMRESSCKTDRAEVDTKIFQSVKQFKLDECYLHLNIDAIFSNVFVVEDQYLMIDYEWVMDSPVPLKYFYYRCILWFLNDNKNRVEQLKLDLFHYFGFTKKELVMYGNMENDFQCYVRGSKVPLWQINANLNHWKLPFEDYIRYENRLKEKCQLKVYYDYGNGYSEKNSMIIVDKIFNEKASVKLPIPEKCVSIRIDVAKYPCLLAIDHIIKVTDRYELKEIKVSEIATNGNVLNNDILVFHTDEPHMYIELLPCDNEIVMDISLNELSVNHAQKLSFVWENLEDMKRQLKECGDLKEIQKQYIDELTNLCKEKDEYAKKLEKLCVEKDSYANSLIELCSQKDDDYRKIEVTHLNIAENAECLRKELQSNAIQIHNLESELQKIKHSFWFRLLMKIKKLVGRG